MSAVAVGQKLGFPKRILSILTGEGLVNDATALTLFTVAVSAVAGTRVFIESPLLFFGYEVVAGVAVGLALAVVVHWIRTPMHDSPLETVLGLALPFAAYLAAEELTASGVLAVVAAGLYMGHRATEVSVSTRIQERSVWGLLHWARRALVRRDRLGRDPLSFREHVVVGWAGMRGVVTLAAAGGIPMVVASGDPFPARELIQTIAFVVAVGTLLIQGATMPWLIRRLGVTDPHERRRVREEREHAVAIARGAAEQALVDIAKNPPPAVDGDAALRILDRVRRSVRACVDAQRAESENDAEHTVGAGALLIPSGATSYGLDAKPSSLPATTAPSTTKPSGRCSKASTSRRRPRTNASIDAREHATRAESFVASYRTTMTEINPLARAGAP